MKFCIALLAFVAISFFSFSQSIPKNPNVTDAKGLRQGKWTLLFDANWTAVTDYSKAVYYRLINYTDDKPVGIVRDYYPSGKVQWAGRLLEDRPQEIMDSIAVWYREDGSKEIEREFNTGVMISQDFYNPDGSKTISNWFSINDTANQLANSGKIQEATTLFETALEQARIEFSENHSNYALALSNLGSMYWQIGLFDRAENFFLESLEVTSSLGDSETEAYAAALNNAANLYSNMGQLDKALSMHKQALSIREKVLGKESALYAGSLNNIGDVYRSMQQYGLAEAAYLECKEIKKKIFGVESMDYAIILDNIAILYQEAGYLDNAEKYFEEAKPIFEKVIGVDHPDYIIFIHNLAQFYSRKGQFAKSEPLFISAKDNYRKIYGAHSPGNGVILFNLANLYLDADDLQKAGPVFSEVNQFTFFQIRNLFSYMSGIEKESFYGTLKWRFEVFNSFATLAYEKGETSTLGEMYDNQLLTKAILFNTSFRIRRRILASKNDSLIVSYNRWQNMRSLLAKAYQMTDQDRESRNLDISAIESDINVIEKKLSQESEIFKQSDGKTEYSWRDVQSRLKKHEAAIEVVRFRKYKQYYRDTLYYAALIITAEADRPEFVLFENGFDMESRLIKFYKNSIQFKSVDSLSYNNFWAPIAKVIREKKIRNVFLSPDGIYNLINLKTLYNPATNQFLADETDIHIVVNTTDLNTRKKSSMNRLSNSDIALFGYPEYNVTDKLLASDSSKVKNSNSDIKRDFPGGIIPRLPGTHEEVRQVEKIFARKNMQVSQYTESLATEEAILNLKNPAILHIATHGFFLETTQGNGNFSGYETETFTKNPLLKCGLLLAGAQRAIDGNRTVEMEDGILTAYEAMNLNLDETELVVLSACETGLGEIRNGEGVYGLQRAFQTAGAKSVLMSLWKVDDNATQELMTSFYKNWLKSGDKRDAFNKAQSTVRAKYKHPYYWGAFVLVGE